MFGLYPPFAHVVVASVIPHCVGLSWIVRRLGGSPPPQGSSLLSELCCLEPSSLNRSHPPYPRAHRDFTAWRLIRDAFAVRAAGSSLDRHEIAARPATSASDQRPRKHPCRDPGLRPSCVSPNAAAQTRIVSKARIRLDSRKSVRSFKGIICVDIAEFESFSIGAGWCQALSDAPSI
jgi:hypothetical protein